MIAAGKLKWQQKSPPKNTALFHGTIHQANWDILTGLSQEFYLLEIGIEIGIENAARGIHKWWILLLLHPFVLWQKVEPPTFLPPPVPPLAE